MPLDLAHSISATRLRRRKPNLKPRVSSGARNDASLMASAQSSSMLPCAQHVQGTLIVTQVLTDKQRAQVL